MAPKRANKPTKAVQRKSARLQSQEPPSDDHIALREELQQNETEPPSPLLPVKRTAIIENSKMRRELTMQHLRESYARRLEQEEKEEKEEAQAVAAVEPQASPAPAAPAAITPPEQPRAGWRQMLTSLGGYFTSPFVRKRPADDDDDDTLPMQPSQKRSRVEEPAAIRVQEQELTTSAGEQPQSPPSPPPAAEQPQKRRAEEDTPLQQSQKRRRVEEPQNIQFVGEDTPQPTRHVAQQTPRSGPSSKNPRLPTSLSTITEYTEPSLFSNLSESLLEGTPSRPPRDQPQRGLLQVPQSTPSGLSQKTPTMRRSAQLRAARKAGLGTPSSGLNMRAATPQPKEPNADIRQAKLERIRMLQKELLELEQDEDVKEMQANRRKRVKIDHLPTIPHNRPGDPSGMFRVPEGDSDDEMEVYDDVEERSNVFEELHSMEDQRMDTSPVQQQADATPKQQQVDVTQVQPQVVDAPLAQQMDEDEEEWKFEFPSVGPMPDDYYVSEEFKEAACGLFEAGLKVFMANLDAGVPWWEA